MTKISGTIDLPGDKSISHRAALFSSLIDGVSTFTNFNLNEDCHSTLKCLQQMGIHWKLTGTELSVMGQNIADWIQPDSDLYAGNSGTTARLISGILSNLKFSTVLTGDASLSKRPMDRIINPLNQMGAKIEANKNLLPLAFHPVSKTKAIRYPLPVASAQVKSAILLSGLFANGQTEIIEDIPTRDHTERMLGLKIVENSDGTRSIFSSAGVEIPNLSMRIPGDFSSAAFFMAAALVCHDSELVINNVSLNPTRTGLLEILIQMGAALEIHRLTDKPEPTGNIVIRHSHLENKPIPANLVANIIDEIPILAILGTQASGTFEITDARELRYKESDRIALMVENLRKTGVVVDEFEDGFRFNGPVRLTGAKVRTAGDHRIAMAFAIANLFSEDEIIPDDKRCASVSFPDFWDILDAVS